MVTRLLISGLLCLCEPVLAGTVAIVDMQYDAREFVFTQSVSLGESSAPDSMEIASITPPQKVPHGDKIANIIRQINPNTSIIKVKISNSTQSMVSSIEYLSSLSKEIRPEVINISMTSNNPCSPELANAITQGRARGVVFVAALGNEGAPLAASPASCEKVIAVGSYKKNTNTPAKYSNRSDAAIYVDEDMSKVIPEWDYSYLGTSFSAAVISGIVSLNARKYASMSIGESKAALTRQVKNLQNALPQPRKQ